MSSQSIDLNIIILILQLVIAVITIFVNYRIATHQGEMAATKYSFTEKKRTEHYNDVIEELHDFDGRMSDPTNLMRIFVSNGTLSNYDFNIQLEEPFPIEYEFLFSHLKTGYPTLYQNLLRYKRKYNDLSIKVLQYFRDILDKWIHSTQVEFNYPGMMLAISDAFRTALDLNRTIQEAVTENTAVRLGSSKVPTNTRCDAEKICASINDILQNHFNDVNILWQAAQSLRKERTVILSAFKRIEYDMQAGLPLQGHCSAGRTAGYE